MQIIAFITDQLEVAKILKHIGEQTSRAPPLMPTDSLKKWMRGLVASVSVEVAFQQNIVRFSNVEPWDSRKWHGFDLLKMEASGAT